MTINAYMTIDDSPTYHTDDLTEYLLKKGIPAVFFCVGSSYKDLGIPCQGIEDMPDPIARAIERDFLIGNHTFTHPRYSDITFEEMVSEIEKTEKLIEGLYKKAGKNRAAKVFRFRDIDRGCGTSVIDYNKAGQHAQTIRELFLGGVNLQEVVQTDEKLEKKRKLQDYLKREGFTADIFKGITFPWYTETEMALARDSLYTYSTSDWMMNPDFTPYAKDWAYQSVDALKGKIDDDPWLKEGGSTHIILAHDHNRLFDVTTALIDHMISKGFRFIDAVA